MDQDEVEFLLSLTRDFIVDARFQLDELEEAGLSLENALDASLLSNTRKLLHSLKGSAQAVDFQEFAHVVHQMESLLAARSDGPAVGVLLNVVDRLKEYLKIHESAGDPKPAADVALKLIRDLT